MSLEHLSRSNLGSNLGQHVRFLGWLFAALGLVGLLVATFVFLLLTTIGLASGDPDARVVLPVVGISVGFFVAMLSLPGLVAGYGLVKRRPWARYLALVIAFFNLVNIPLGTMLGLYSFWVLLQSEAAAYFEDWQPDEAVT